MMARLCDWISRRLWVYRKGHLLHADGSLYMGRWTLFETRWLSARLHHIATPDLDRHLHDHPWNFLSIVLAGGYVEERPWTIEPCFWSDSDSEIKIASYRSPGSVALRRATDRHLISFVQSDTWSLFIYGRVRQWWGFFTPAGKVFWKNYPSCHDAVVQAERPGEPDFVKAKA